MADFSGTIEFLGRGAAIVTLLDEKGGWSGSCRIEVRSRSRADLYEVGYTYASVNATSKGGRLGRFSREASS